MATGTLAAEFLKTHLTRDRANDEFADKVRDALRNEALGIIALLQQPEFRDSRGVTLQISSAAKFDSNSNREEDQPSKRYVTLVQLCGDKPGPALNLWVEVEAADKFKLCAGYTAEREPFTEISLSRPDNWERSREFEDFCRAVARLVAEARQEFGRSLPRRANSPL